MVPPMKPRVLLSLGIACLLLAGCGSKVPDMSGLEVGGIYSIRRPGGDVGIVKLLRIDPVGTIHVRLFVNRFPERPESITLEELRMQGGQGGYEIGIDHIDIPAKEFLAMEPAFLVGSEVTEEELAPVEQWRGSGGAS